jgi:hypothetical protein
MDPTRAAKLLRNIGAALILLALALRVVSISMTQLAVDNMTAVLDEQGQLLPLRLLAGDGGAEVQPVVRSYSFSPDGEMITFQAGLAEPDNPYALVRSGWYSMPARGGSVVPSTQPQEDIRPFVLRGSQLFLLVSDGSTLASGSPEGTRVLHATLSPDGQAIAFAAEQQNGSVGLYVLYADEQLDWLGDEIDISEIIWSPDGETLAYVAARGDFYQLIRVERGGGSLRQLTRDGTFKLFPEWSDDGGTIAFLALETNPRGPDGQRLPRDLSTDVYSIPAQGGELRRLTESHLDKHNLAWINGGTEIAYSIEDPDSRWPYILRLFALDPQAGSQRQVYPPLAVAGLVCPENLRLGQDGVLQAALYNGGLLPATAPLVLRSGPQPRPITEDRRAGATRVEPVDLPPAGTRILEWPLRPAPGLFTHASVLIDQGEHFPAGYAACFSLNTRMGLPNLAFLPSILPLVAAGMLLLVPWLRHMKKRWLWIAWAALPLVILALVLYESRLVDKIFTPF